MSDVLERIVRHKQGEIAAAKTARPEAEVRAAAAAAPPPRDFFAALAGGPPIRLIAEVKRASPSAGLIREDFDPVAIAETYARHGAACVSVLTDEHFFRGSLDYLRAVRAAIEIPVLRKDFLIDSYQVWEARAAGADAILLIAECLDDCGLRSLHDLALELGMTPLVELYEPENLERVLDAGAMLIGVNNRNLRTFEVDLDHTIRMRSQIPSDRLLVGESGIRDRADALLLESAGVDAMLVGETLMRPADIGAAVDALLGCGPS